MYSPLVYLVTCLFSAILFTGGLWASEGHKHHVKEKVSLQNQKSIKGTQKICPIGKEKIDPEVFIAFQGQKVYFCCPGCDGKFMKDSEKKFAEMKERGEITESIQTICPVSGDVLEDHETSLTLPGRKIYLCCKNCVKKFKKKKELYLKKMRVPPQKLSEEHKKNSSKAHH